MNGTYTHPGYIATGFSEIEKNVLAENSLLNIVIASVPDYASTDLTNNSY